MSREDRAATEPVNAARTVSIMLTQTPDGLTFQMQGAPTLIEVVGLCEYGALFAKRHMIEAFGKDVEVSSTTEGTR